MAPHPIMRNHCLLYIVMVFTEDILQVKSQVTDKEINMKLSQIQVKTLIRVNISD